MSPLDIVRDAVTAIRDGRIEEAMGFYADTVLQRSPAPDSPGFRIRRGK